MVLTFPCLTLLSCSEGIGHKWWLSIGACLASVTSGPRALLSSFMLGVQLWLFMWAPGNGYGLAVSLGYFMMPIAMVIVGRIAFQDRMSRFQQIACLLAVLGILNQLAISQTLAWPTLVVCVGYPVYFGYGVKRIPIILVRSGLICCLACR